MRLLHVTSKSRENISTAISLVSMTFHDFVFGACWLSIMGQLAVLAHAGRIAVDSLSATQQGLPPTTRSCLSGPSVNERVYMLLPPSTPSSSGWYTYLGWPRRLIKLFWLATLRCIAQRGGCCYGSPSGAPGP